MNKRGAGRNGLPRKEFQITRPVGRDHCMLTISYSSSPSSLAL